MFLGALPLALGPARRPGPALACVGVMPYAVMQPRHGTVRGRPSNPGTGRVPRCATGTMNWATEHVALADIQRLRPAPAGRGRRAGRFDRATSSTSSPRSSTPTGRRRWRGSSTRARTWRRGPLRRADPGAALGRLRATVVVGRARAGPPGRPRHPGHARQRRPRPAARCSAPARWRDDDVLGRGHHGRARPRAAARRACRPTCASSVSSPTTCLLPHVDAMVTNGGYGGVQQALAHGVPLVVAGDSEDKPEVAARVQWSGAGINLHTGRPSPAMVAARRAPGAAPAGPIARRAHGLQRRDRGERPLRTISAALVELCEARDAGARWRPAPGRAEEDRQASVARADGTWPAPSRPRRDLRA